MLMTLGLRCDGRSIGVWGCGLGHGGGVLGFVIKMYHASFLFIYTVFMFYHVCHPNEQTLLIDVC